MHYFFTLARVIYRALALVASLAAPAFAAGADAPAADAGAKDHADLVREPVACRVYQRDRNGRADIPLTLDPGVKDATITSARLSGLPASASNRLADGKFAGVPTGGRTR